jgi:HlyD family secretion protein
MARLSISRKILPGSALLALGVSVWLIVAGLPDRTLAAADKTPPKASQATGSKPSVAASGVVEPSNEITDIGTNVPGIVTEVYVQIGQRVERGTPLFAIDRRQAMASSGETSAGIREAQAQIAEAQTAVRTAQRQLSLYRSVDDPRAISAAEVIAAEGTVANARARMQAAQAQLSAARARSASASTELARHIVYAPISGEILDIDIHPGEYAATGMAGGGAAPYMQIGETSPLYVRIDVDETEAPRITPGTDAILVPRGNSDKHIRVTFVRIEPQIVPKRSLTNAANERVDVRVMQLIYAVPSGETNLRVGQQVDAFIFIGTRK